jgi:hypothetical protein
VSELLHTEVREDRGGRLRAENLCKNVLDIEMRTCGVEMRDHSSFPPGYIMRASLKRLEI